MSKTRLPYRSWSKPRARETEKLKIRLRKKTQLESAPARINILFVRPIFEVPSCFGRSETICWVRRHRPQPRPKCEPECSDLPRSAHYGPKALAFHDEKGAEHRFLWEAPASGSCSGQCKFQCPKEFVIECSGTLGCEQCHILNDFLSVDSGQLLSVWFCLNLILPLRSSAFYTIWVISGFSHGRKPLIWLAFSSFAHGCVLTVERLWFLQVNNQLHQWSNVVTCTSTLYKRWRARITQSQVYILQNSNLYHHLSIIIHLRKDNK